MESAVPEMLVSRFGRSNGFVPAAIFLKRSLARANATVANPLQTVIVSLCSDRRLAIWVNERLLSCSHIQGLEGVPVALEEISPLAIAVVSLKVDGFVSLSSVSLQTLAVERVEWEVKASVQSILMIRNGAACALLSEDSETFVAFIKDGKVSKVAPVNEIPSAFAVDDDDAFYFGCGTCVFKASKGQSVLLHQHTHAITSLAVCKNQVCFGDSMGRICRLLKSGAVQVMHWHAHPVLAMHFDGPRQLYSVASEGVIAMWNLGESSGSATARPCRFLSKLFAEGAIRECRAAFFAPFQAPSTISPLGLVLMDSQGKPMICYRLAIHGDALDVLGQSIPGSLHPSSQNRVSVWLPKQRIFVVESAMQPGTLQGISMLSTPETGALLCRSAEELPICPSSNPNIGKVLDPVTQTSISHVLELLIAPASASDASGSCWVVTIECEVSARDSGDKAASFLALSREQRMRFWWVNPLTGMWHLRTVIDDPHTVPIVSAAAGFGMIFTADALGVVAAWHSIAMGEYRKRPLGSPSLSWNRKWSRSLRVGPNSSGTVSIQGCQVLEDAVVFSVLVAEESFAVTMSLEGELVSRSSVEKIDGAAALPKGLFWQNDQLFHIEQPPRSAVAGYLQRSKSPLALPSSASPVHRSKRDRRAKGKSAVQASSSKKQLATQYNHLTSHNLPSIDSLLLEML